VFVRVNTDEGLHGWGEATIPASVESVEAAIHSLGSYLIGKDPSAIEAHWWAMYHAWRWRGGPILTTALAGLDGALWDLEGKRLGVPVYRLLGGPVRDRIRTYASHWIHHAHTIDEAVAEAKEAVRRGFTAFKWSPWGLAAAVAGAGRQDDDYVIARGREWMAAVREAVGPEIDIMIECGERFTPRSALLAARAIAEYRPFWMEEPIPKENPKALAQLRQECPVPIATGENLVTKWEFRELLETQGAQVIQPDLIHAAGISEVRKIATLADTYFVPLAPHNSSGPIATLMSIHLMAAIPNFLILEEIEYEQELRNQICTHPLPIKDGFFSLPTEPGLGTDLNLEVLKDHPYKPQAISGRRVPGWYSGAN
jgi:galactonate dehydratase